MLLRTTKTCLVKRTDVWMVVSFQLASLRTRQIYFWCWPLYSTRKFLANKILMRPCPKLCRHKWQWMIWATTCKEQMDKRFHTYLSLFITIVLKICVQPVTQFHCFECNWEYNVIKRPRKLLVQMALLKKQGYMWPFIEGIHIIHMWLGPYNVQKLI